jgi:glycosyltransferase involved in cell wall biosynthesis
MDSNMRILEIAGSGSIGTDEMGPVSTVVCELSNHFNEFGHAVTIVDAETGNDRRRVSDGITLINIKSKPRVYAASVYDNKYKRIIKCWLNEYRFIKDLISRVELSKFHILHSHECRPTLILQKTRTEGLVYTSHTPSWCSGPQKENLKASLRGKLKIAPKLEKSVIRKSSLTVALGDYLEKNVPGANIKVIPNGIDLKKWHPINKKEARRWLGLSDDEFILIFVGRISPVKGVDILIKAIRRSLSKLRNLRVIIIGSLSGTFGSRAEITPYSQTIMKEAKDLPVEIKGFINNGTRQFSYYLSAADLAIVPSLHEPQGLVVLEALAMGKPVVASRIGGIPQMLNENIGCLFEAGDSSELADNVRTLYEDRDKLEFMSRCCRTFVEENFTWEAVARRYCAAFEEVVRDRSAKFTVQS